MFEPLWYYVFLGKQRSINIFTFLQNLSFLSEEYKPSGLVMVDGIVEMPWKLKTMNYSRDLKKLLPQPNALTYIQGPQVHPSASCCHVGNWGMGSQHY